MTVTEASSEGKQPTIADANEIATAADAAALNEPTVEKARASASKAAQKAGEKRGLTLTKEDADLIGTAVVDAIEARGGFDAPPDAVQAPAPPEAIAPAPGEQQPAPGESTQQPAAKRSWAEKFMGA